MKTCSAFSLLLMLCYLCRAQKHSGDDDVLLQAPNVESGEEEQESVLQADIWAELRSLRDMVLVQQVELRHLTGRVTAAESLVEALQRDNTAMEARMTAAERSAEELQMENDAQAIELAVTQQKLTVSEGRVEELETQQEAQATELAVIQQKLTVSEGRVEELETQQEGKD
ncbi:ciliary rootlet coiled-coil protein 2-like [Centropristis striata]|uniref:ciliary rootlet coiled-coil protein 2-like n=1 Tax=Centropristis striata TaxID=184440 RepID=UPI0027E121D6|nr:ciliary rootlet coiled-coil protein 2-like [Centropristis striata]